MNNRGTPVNAGKPSVIKNETKTPIQTPARNMPTGQSAPVVTNAASVKSSPVGVGEEKSDIKGLQNSMKNQPPQQNRGSRFSNAPISRGPGGQESNQAIAQTAGNLKRDFRSTQQSGVEKELSQEKVSEKSGAFDAGDEQSDGLHKEKKFSGRCRLFVGNLPNDMTENEFKKMFDAYGEYSEVFLNSSRGFAFIRFDTRHHAEDARSGVDGKLVRGRPLRVRFAAHSAALRVRYLSSHVSNEMLAEAFSIFGEVERAVICVDDRGKSTGEGIVEFARKPGATTALKRISEGVFLMTVSPRPIAVELLEQTDENDGMPEVFIQKTSDSLKEREQPPRFAQPGSFEYEFGLKWKTLYQLLHEQQEALKKNFEEEVVKMEMDMEAALLEQHTALLRQDLMRRQEELRRLEEQTQKEIQRRMDSRRQDEERRRQQNNKDSFEIRRPEENMWRQQQQQQEDEQYGGPMERRGGLMQSGMSNDNRMMPGQLLQRNDRNGTLAPGAVLNRSDRGVGGMAPPLQPPPVPPVALGMERGRPQQMGGPGIIGPGGPSMPPSLMGPGGPHIQGNNGDKNMQQMISAAQQISKLIPQMMQQPQQRSRFDHPPQGMSGPGGNMGPGGPGMDNPRMSGQSGGGRDDFFESKRMRRF